MPYDNLNRLTASNDGMANAGNTGILSYWQHETLGWTMDATGNFTNETKNYDSAWSADVPSAVVRRMRAAAGKAAVGIGAKILIGKTMLKDKISCKCAKKRAGQHGGNPGAAASDVLRQRPPTKTVGAYAPI